MIDNWQDQGDKISQLEEEIEIKDKRIEELINLVEDITAEVENCHDCINCNEDDELIERIKQTLNKESKTNDR